MLELPLLVLDPSRLRQVLEPPLLVLLVLLLVLVLALLALEPLLVLVPEPLALEATQPVLG